MRSIERRLRLRIGIFAAVALALLLSPSAVAKAHRRDFSAEFSLAEVNGYSISVSASHKSVQIRVSDETSSPQHLATSVYTFPGSASRNGIHADLGSFGAISMQFKPSGEVRTEKLPKAYKGCDSPGKIVRHLGTFVGGFNFEGEDGYTTAKTTEVSGSVGDPDGFLCGTFVDESGSGHRHRHRRVPPPYLGATTAHNSLGFAAGFFGSHRRHVGFIASSQEKNGTATIWRWVSTVGPRSLFQFDRRLATATVTPPPPFSGTATFERGPKGSRPSWSGSLSVSFPGRSEVPLTGANFTSVIFGRF